MRVTKVQVVMIMEGVQWINASLKELKPHFQQIKDSLKVEGPTTLEMPEVCVDPGEGLSVSVPYNMMCFVDTWPRYHQVIVFYTMTEICKKVQGLTYLTDDEMADITEQILSAIAEGRLTLRERIIDFFLHRKKLYRCFRDEYKAGRKICEEYYSLIY